MPGEEIPRSFPQPSRKYDGPLLDPLLVEEDFAETAGIVRRFALHNQGFVEQDILLHLAANGVSLYGTQEDWDVLFAEMRERIVNDGVERKPPVDISWVVQRLGERVVYSMVQLSATEITEKPLVEVTDREKSAAQVVSEPETVGELDEVRVLIIAAKALLGDAADGMIRRRELTTALARRLAIAPSDADKFIGGALSSGRLSKVSSQGAVYVTTSLEAQTELPTAAEPEVSEDHPDAEAKLAELDAYMQVVAYVMQSLTALRDISMGQPYDKLWRRSSLEETMTFEDFKRFVRRMESDALVLIDKDAKLSTKTGHSKIIRGSKIFVADKHVRGSWKVNPKENLHNMYEHALEVLLEEEA